MRRTCLIVLFAGLILIAGCELPLPSDEGGNSSLLPVFEEPVVELKQSALTQYPGLAELGAWYCPELIDFGGALACDALLGPVPDRKDMEFRFQLSIDVENPNTYPLPAVEFLTRLTLFPDHASQALGAVCVGFCEEGDPDCGGDPLEGQCSSDEPEILSLEDLAEAALGLLFAVVTDEGQGIPPELRIRTIPAGEHGTLNVTLAVDIDLMLNLLEEVFLDHWDEYLSTDDFSVTIPYQVEGTLWFIVEGLGKFPISFGPLEGEWEI